MKITKQGTLPSDIEYQIACKNCGTEATATASEGRYHSDQREGDAMIFTCPVCLEKIWTKYKSRAA